MNKQCGECVRGLTPQKEVCTVCGGTALLKEPIDVVIPKVEEAVVEEKKAPKKK